MPTDAEISAALHAALEKCFSSEEPLDCLAQQIGELALRPDWTKADVTRVTQRAMHLLAGLLAPPTRQAAPDVGPR